MRRILLTLAVVAMLTGCKTRERVVTVETTRTDTAYITRVALDSIYIETLRHDSVSVRDKGDTLLIEHWHTEWRDRGRERVTHDTTYTATHDTIPQPYPVEVVRKVVQPLNWWQRVRLSLANVILWTCIFVVGVWAWKILRIKFK